MPSHQVSRWGAPVARWGCWHGHRAPSHSLCPLPGLRILLVDQWVETGGTMRAAIQLVERLGGVVAGRRWGARAPRRCTHGCSGTTVPVPRGGWH